MFSNELNANFFLFIQNNKLQAQIELQTCIDQKT